MKDPLDRRPLGGMQVANDETHVEPTKKPNVVMDFINNNVKPLLVVLVITGFGILGMAQEGLFVLPTWLQIVIGIILVIGMALGIRPKKNKDGSIVIAGSPEDSNVINAKKEKDELK